MVTHVIKRTGHAEPYLEYKLHASLVSALHGVRAFEGEAVLLADRTCAHVWKWIEGKAEVTSRDIRTQAFGALAALHTEAAYAYSAHDSVL